MHENKQLADLGVRDVISESTAEDHLWLLILRGKLIQNNTEYAETFCQYQEVTTLHAVTRRHSYVKKRTYAWMCII